jgi:dCTP deaminase
MTMYGVLCDHEITELCSTDPPMLDRFIPEQRGKPSYGLGSFGYDLRLGKRFLVPLGGVNQVLDPIDFPTHHFREYIAEDTLELLPGSQVLSESVEWFNMPDDICGVCWGKSSYARCGLLVNVTPLEPGWKGILTLELANVSPYPIRLHVGQGMNWAASPSFAIMDHWTG